MTYLCERDYFRGYRRQAAPPSPTRPEPRRRTLAGSGTVLGFTVTDQSIPLVVDRGLPNCSLTVLRKPNWIVPPVAKKSGFAGPEPAKDKKSEAVRPEN